jgi:hypothetical protein
MKGQPFKKKKVAVMMGGLSCERDEVTKVFQGFVRRCNKTLVNEATELANERYREFARK